MVNIYEQYCLMSETQVIVSYNGSVNEEVIGSILQLSDVRLKQLNVAARKKKSIAKILIECLRNVFKHGDARQVELAKGKSCMLMVGQNKDHYFIVSGNYIKKGKVAALRQRLEELRPKTAPEKEAAFINFCNDQDTQVLTRKRTKKGIIGMLKEFGQQISYDFKPIDDQYDFFCMEIKVAAG
jgi:hypothetical protein